MKISPLQRLKFAFNAFMLKKTTIYFPYQYHCDLRKDMGRLKCDNIRRKSNCQNEGKIVLANPSIEICINESEHFYHICEECAKKYIGQMDGEEF
jgi:hypothetical protein